MSIFLTGATGTLGRAVVARLTATGHPVRALARSPGNEALLRTLGVKPVPGNLFDRSTLVAGMAGCDAVLHLATRIPPGRDAMRRGAWAENDRIRTEGTRVLVDAVMAAAVGTVLYPSVCLIYADGGDRWLDIDAPVDPGPGMLASTVAAEQTIARAGTAGRRALVLRMGFFYGTTAPNTIETVELARRGLAPLTGPRRAYVSHVWVDDAAAAIAAALDRAPSGTYNVVDDDPLTRGEMAAVLAAAVGRRRVAVTPRVVARVIGGPGVLPLTRSQRVSNRRFRDATGWAPSVPSAREGWQRIADSLRGRPAP